MKKTEICLECGDDFIPKRRGVQKFCSNSCRSRHWLLKQNKTKVSKILEKQKNQLPDVKSGNKADGMSLAGVGNAAVGVAVVEVVKNILKTEDNKPATKNDIRELKTLINGGRFLPVNNVPKDSFGRHPYYDIETGNVVFFFI
ncbi:hypothetical protein [Thalassobellus suaedae]|uniref:Uncharacterized protein n=1 Tax=Thalassobellus suaedae TaxID=3074124 RepID=A0ABY9XZI9_9FLAO|nr:hypothetical protein RHP49_09475 [Flavobacteriaceae bacterium HL-DH10]